MQTKLNKILIIGTRHGAQDEGHFKKRVKFLRSRKFDKNFIKIEKDILLKMRAELLKIADDFNPDVIFEECSPWIKKPGDTWKKYSGSKNTILEKKYSDKHRFVDARMLKSGKKPPVNKREDEIVRQIVKIFKKNNFKKGVLVVGRTHLKNITNLFKGNSFKVIPKDLNNQKELRGLIKKWRILYKKYAKSS